MKLKPNHLPLFDFNSKDPPIDNKSQSKNTRKLK